MHDVLRDRSSFYDFKTLLCVSNMTWAILRTFCGDKLLVFQNDSNIQNWNDTRKGMIVEVKFLF